MDNLKEEYKKNIKTTLDFTNLSISELVFLNRMIKCLKRKEYDFIISELMDMKLVDLLEKKLNIVVR